MCPKLDSTVVNSQRGPGAGLHSTWERACLPRKPLSSPLECSVPINQAEFRIRQLGPTGRVTVLALNSGQADKLVNGEAVVAGSRPVPYELLHEAAGSLDHWIAGSLVRWFGVPSGIKYCLV